MTSDILNLLGLRVPSSGVGDSPSSWLPGLRPGHSGATAPDSHRLPRTVALSFAASLPQGYHRPAGG